MLRWYRLVHLFTFGLLTGFLAVAQWSLIPAQNRLPATGYATLEQGMNRVLETLTPILMIVSLVSAAAVLVAARHQGRRAIVLNELVPTSFPQVGGP